MLLRGVSAKCRWRWNDASSLIRSLTFGHETAAGVTCSRITR